MDTQVLGEAIAAAIGDREVTHLVLTTHDLDPEFLEQEVLPAFLGIQAVHSPRIRAIQVGTEIRERRAAIDVFYEGRALAAYDGAARLGWNRIRMSGHSGGVFHPKVSLAICADQDGAESLLVVTGSANLTRSGWWTNVECVDLALLPAGASHGYVGGLSKFAELLRRERGALSPGSAVPAVDAVVAHLRGMSGYAQRTLNGRLRPTFLPGYGDLVVELQALFDDRLAGANLEIVSPFLDGSTEEAVATIQQLKEYFDPVAIRLCLPVRAERTTITKELYEAVAALPGVEWAALPSGYTRASEGPDAVARSVHAKVYRFWRRASSSGETLDVTVIGSHNLTRAAHSGTKNWEVSVVHEPEKSQGSWLLEAGLRKPEWFEEVDPDAETEPMGELVPVTVRYDWQSRKGSVRRTARRPPGPVRLSQNRVQVLEVDTGSDTEIELGRRSEKLREALLRSCVLRADWGDSRWGYLLVEEVNHDLKPDPLEYLELTPAEILALWSIPDLRERIERMGLARDIGGRLGEDLDESRAPAASSMFERFAGVFHAFRSLRTTIGDRMAGHDQVLAAATLYADQLGSPLNLLRLVRKEVEDPEVETDLELAYVTYGCARLLDRYVARTWPELAADNAAVRKDLTKEIRYGSEVRRRLVADADDEAEMRAFLDWFDAEFGKEVSTS